MFLKKVFIRGFEVGLQYRNGEFNQILDSGLHWILDPLQKIVIRTASLRDPWIVDDQLDLMVKSGKLAARAQVVDLKDHQRALVWIDGRFSTILGPGLHAYWLGHRDVKVEIVDTANFRLQHADLRNILRLADAIRHLDVCVVNRDCVGVLYVDGRYVTTLEPGQYAFWRQAVDARVVEIDMRENQLDVSGQEIMTLDKVSLRMNALVTYLVSDPRRLVSSTHDARQALYRDVQLALREVIGSRELDSFLSDKNDITNELDTKVREKGNAIGIDVRNVGIKDIILPGDMKDLMNRVTEAKKAAEANLIARREETAAMRSQANTAKMLAENPTLMRMRELEILEKIASAGKLNIVVGEKGLTDRVVNLL
jgi:regulator of protease activity HflC (stomatin/prohibitin superfamily)